MHNYSCTSKLVDLYHLRFPLALAEMASDAARWSRLFGSVRGAVIGMIHVQALPGKASERQKSTWTQNRACTVVMHAFTRTRGGRFGKGSSIKPGMITSCTLLPSIKHIPRVARFQAVLILKFWNFNRAKLVVELLPGWR